MIVLNKNYRIIVIWSHSGLADNKEAEGAAKEAITPKNTNTAPAKDLKSHIKTSILAKQNTDWLNIAPNHDKLRRHL